MIRKLRKIAMAALFASLALASCKNPLYDGIVADVKDPVYYTVTFNTDEGSSVPPQTILAGGVATKPADPTKAENTFMNWYTESACENVYDFSAKVSRSMTLYAGWQYGTDPAPIVEVSGSSSIKITWTPPSGTYYALVYRLSSKTGKYELIGKLTSADGNSYLPDQCAFYDYFTDSDYSYSYCVKNDSYDSASADWITRVTLDSVTIKGRSSDAILTVKDSYTVSYDATWGVLSFDPAVKTYPSHSQAGTFTNYMILCDGATDDLIDSTKPFGWANLTKLAYASNFKTDGIPLSVRLSCAYIKSDRSTNLKSITYIDMSGTTLSGKTKGILIPAYKTHAIYFDANGGEGSMNMTHARDGVATALPASTFTRSGFTFAGWATSSSATTADYADGASVIGGSDDMTLYAVWKQNYISIRFDREEATYTAICTYSNLKLMGQPESISGGLDNPPLTVIISGLTESEVPEINWISSDTTIVSVGYYHKLNDPKTYHNLIVHGTGTVKISASLPNGSSATCNLSLTSIKSFSPSLCVEQPAPTYPSITLAILTSN